MINAEAASPPVETPTRPAKARPTAAGRQIRGSSLLLAGRLLSMASNFGIQVLIVRYLSKSDYGAFAYALSIAALGQTLATLGFDRAITRFIPIYQERQDYPRLFGTLALAIGSVLGIGLSVIVLVHLLQGVIAGAFVSDPQSMALLLILIGLAPVDAMDDVIEGLFAVFSSPRAIFLRKYVLAPSLRVAVVLALVIGQSDVYFLAGGYLAAGIAGIAFYTALLLRAMRQKGLFQYFKPREIVVPVREILWFTIPLLSSDLVYVLMNSVNTILLERSGGSLSVASFRAVQPAARLNQMVLVSFALLFTPAAARLFARQDREGINALYWQTTLWMAVVSFPVFAVTFSLAQPLTLLLFGERYADSAPILALLAFGYYFNTALGQNGLILKIFGNIRYIVGVNVAAAVANLALNLLLIPRFGAIGAAVGTTATLIAHNILKQWGLRLGSGVRIFERRALPVYASIIGAALGLLVLQWLLSPNIYVGIALAALASIAVLLLNRRILAVEQTFPELLRFSLVRRLFGVPGAPAADDAR